MPSGRGCGPIAPRGLFNGAALFGIRGVFRPKASGRRCDPRKPVRSAQLRDRRLQGPGDPPQIDGRTPVGSQFQPLHRGEGDAAGLRQGGKTDAQASALRPHELRDDAVHGQGRVVRCARQRPTPQDNSGPRRRRGRGGGKRSAGRSGRRRRRRASPSLPWRDVPSPLRRYAPRLEGSRRMTGSEGCKAAWAKPCGTLDRLPARALRGRWAKVQRPRSCRTGGAARSAQLRGGVRRVAEVSVLLGSMISGA